MVDKEKIEKAIQNITGLLVDFGEAVDIMRNTRELLYSFIEEEPKDEKRDN